jgi:uncharacterized protein
VSEPDVSEPDVEPDVAVDAPGRAPTPLTARRPGPDVVRALAMAGVITMNYHGYLIIKGGRQEGGWLYDLFDPWTGPLSTRFAATFVLTAGVGITLLTRSSIGDRERTVDMRWRLVRRGLLLYGFGIVLDFVWPGTILVYYGAMFVVGAALFTLRSRWVLLVGAIAALAAWGIRWWQYERELDGIDTSWLSSPGQRSPRGLVIDVFVNGTHPLLPWLAFLCAGIVLGRLLDAAWWRPAAAATGFTLFVAGSMAAASATGDRGLLLLSAHPFDRGLAYTASALGTALLAFTAISTIADRFAGTAVIDALRRAGQTSLTIYVAHVLLFNLLVDWLDVVQPGGIATSLAFAAVVWSATTAAAVAYHHRFGRGPAERLYRRLTA